ncbi:cobalamin-binding protein [Chloroflexota bacterium]
MRLVRLGISIVLLSLFVACASPVEEVASFPIEVTDQLGTVVKLDKIPERIVSLTPSSTEILFALGLGDKVVGVTEFCDYPEAAEVIEKIGGFNTADIEKIVVLESDLILAGNIHKDDVIPALERLDLPVFTLDSKTLDEVLESIILVGEVTGKGEEAFHLVVGMRSRIKTITDQTDNLSEAQRPRVFYIVWHDPLMTAGLDTRIHELIIKAGGTNIAQDLTGGYPTIGLETVIQVAPQVIVTSSGHGEGAALPFQFASTEPRLEDTEARINNRVYQINTDLIGRPGPRIVDGLEKFAGFIHPELF